ncbi:hypothetical protein JCM8547_008522 [Rhodosporidiobolus lusitaniae]
MVEELVTEPFSLVVKYLPYDVSLEVAKWVGYLDSDVVDEELVCWPVTSSSSTLRNLCRIAVLNTQPASSPGEEAEGRCLTGLMLEAAGRCKQLRHLENFPLNYPEGIGFADLVKSLPLETFVFAVYDCFPVLPPGVTTEFCHLLYEHVIAHPTLKTLVYTFRPPSNPSAGDVTPREEFTSHLTSLHVSVNAEHVFFSVLLVMASTLLVLSIYVEKPLQKDLAIAAFSQLSLNFWLTDVINHYPRLEKLSISQQDIHPRRFHSPSPSLRLFEFIDLSAHPDRSFGEFGELARNEQASFVTVDFDFVADQESFEKTVKPVEVEEVAEAFDAKGVRFSAKHEIEEILQRRMVEL